MVVIQSLSCVRLFCDPMDSSPPGSSVHGITQAKILEWVAISSSWGLNPHLLHWQADSLPLNHLGSPIKYHTQRLTTFSQAPVLRNSILFYITTAGQSFLNTNCSIISELSVSQPVVILFPRRHLAITIFSCHNLKSRRCHYHPLEARDAAKHPMIHRPSHP